MSKVQTPNVAEEKKVELQETSSEIDSGDHVRRVVVECNATGNQLRHGTIVNITNADKVFAPQTEASSERDYSKGIVTGITLKAVSNSCPEPITVGMKLFENGSSIRNSEGWLFSKQHVDMEAEHAHQNDGYTNLCNILPYEKARLSEVVYTPENVVNNDHISTYGSYNLEKLWKGIVPFPNEDYYYVDSNHVILNVVRNNWEQLGIDLDSEEIREGNYVKLGKDVVQNICSQLYENVILQLPLISFKNMGVRFQSNASGSENYKVVCEFAVKYKFPSV